MNRRNVARFKNYPRIPKALRERFLERMEPIKQVPDRLLDLGCAAGDMRASLRKRYPRCEIISMERDPLFCSASSSTIWSRLLRAESIVCAAPGAIPLPSASIDMVSANLSWVPAEELGQVLSECARILRAPGLLMLVAYGPQTLSELREAWATIDDWQHLHHYADMHDIGDSMVGVGLSDVVVDSERLTVEFDDVPGLIREVRDIGGGTRVRRRRPGLTTPGHLDALCAAYPDAGGFVTASVELVFAHAWLTARPGISVAAPKK